MDAAAAARMSDPALNPNFRRRWQERPAKPVTVAPAEPGLTAMAQALQEAGLRKAKQDREC